MFKSGVNIPGWLPAEINDMRYFRYDLACDFNVILAFDKKDEDKVEFETKMNKLTDNLFGIFDNYDMINMVQEA